MYMTKSKTLVRLQAWYDNKKGLDFLSRCQPQELGLDAKLSYCYTPSGDQHLGRLLKDFSLTHDDTIIDVGCGKGSAMRKMTDFSFSRVDGIELSTQLAETAKSNFERLGVKHCQIFNTNAALFEQFHEYNFVYFFNPFPTIVMRPVIAAIEQSLGDNEREVIIIYLNPVCHDDIEAHGVFRQLGWYPDHWGLRFAIYSNRPQAQSRLKSNKKMRLTT